MTTSIKKDYAWNTVGVLLQNLISPLLLIVITRMNGIGDSGLFSFAFSVAIILWTFGMWGGRTYQVSDVKNTFSNKSYIIVRVLLACAMLPIALCFSFVNHYDMVKTGILVLLVCMKAFESVADAFYGVMQTRGRLYKSGISLTLKASLGFLAFLTTDMLTGNILLSTLCLVLVNLTIFILYDVPITNSLESVKVSAASFASHLIESKTILKVCFPVFIIAFLSAFSLNIPRYFIDIYHNQDIGYFGIIAMPVTLVALMITFILQPNIVGIAQLYHGKRTEYRVLIRKIITYTIVVGVAIIAGTALIGVPVLNFIFGRNFAPYYFALLVTVSGGVVNALVSVFVNVMIVMRSLKPQAYILFFTNLILLPLSYVLIPAWGINVAAGLFLLINTIQLVAIIVVYGRIINRVTNETN